MPPKELRRKVRGPVGADWCSRRHVLLAGLGLGLTGCTSPATTADTDRPSAPAATFPPGVGEITAYPAARRDTAPGISGKDLDGEPLRLSDYRERVVVLNVWASWCNPCKEEAPHLQRAFEETREQGVQFLGINTRDRAIAQAKAFERRYGVTYPSFYDPRGEMVLRFEGHLLPQAIPSTVVIDRRGRIAARALKGLTEEEILAMVEPVIAEGR